MLDRRCAYNATQEEPLGQAIRHADRFERLLRRRGCTLLASHQHRELTELGVQLSDEDKHDTRWWVVSPELTLPPTSPDRPGSKSRRTARINLEAVCADPGAMPSVVALLVRRMHGGDWPLVHPSHYDWPDLSRTAAALVAYDAGNATGEEVGEAFALDTADRNAADTARMVRPGKPKPPGHPDEPFVRKLVRRWQEYCTTTLTDALLAAGYTHRPTGRGVGYKHDVLDSDGAVVFTGSAHEVWPWLRCQLP